MGTPASNSNKRLNVKEAAERAVAYLNELIPSRDRRIEEVELADDDSYWHITLSFLPFGENPFDIGPREYRTFKVDAKSGQVKSMKIRVL